MTAMATYTADVGEANAAWLTGPEGGEALRPHGVSFDPDGEGRVSFGDETFRRLRAFDEEFDCAIILGLGGVPVIQLGGQSYLVVPLKHAGRQPRPPLVTSIPAAAATPPVPGDDEIPDGEADGEPGQGNGGDPLPGHDPILPAGEHVPGQPVVHLDIGDIAAALGLGLRTVQNWAARYGHRRTDEERERSGVPDFPHPAVTVGTGPRGQANPAVDGWMPEQLADIVRWRAERAGPGWPSRPRAARVTWRMMNAAEKEPLGIAGEYQISSTGQVRLKPRRKPGSRR